MSFPYQRLGDFESALARLRGSTELYLRKVQRSSRSADLAHNYGQIANIYSLKDQHVLALYYGEQSLEYSDDANKADYAAEFSSFVAVQHARLNQFEQAEAVLTRSFDYLGRLEAGRERDYAEANVLINAGEVSARRGDAPRALQCYDKAESLIDLDEGHILPTINVLRDRAKAYQTSGQNARAHADLMRAVDLIESSRSNIEESSQRIQFLAARHNTFDQLISLDASAINDTSEAFDIAERSRARALLEGVSVDTEAGEHRARNAKGLIASGHNSRDVNPLTLSGVQSHLPEDLTLLEYVVTHQRTYLFLVSRSRFNVLQSSATTDVLDRLVHDYAADLRRIAPLDELNAKARVLYDYLIKPVEQEIKGATNLCIVPDEALHFLPFAALVDHSDRYLVESHRLTYAPSASVLVRCLREARGKQGQKLDKILAVGNPEFDRDAFPDLQPLPEAEEEALKSAGYYASGSVVLTREKATESSVLAAMRGCEVVDLALHCVVEEGSPGLAALLLAGAIPSKTTSPPSPSPAGGAVSRASRAVERSGARPRTLPQEPVDDPHDGLLFLGELDRIRLPHTKLVVLSSCQSGLGQYYRGEGIVSLIRPFLTSGVPTVVASLWPVSSRATADLVINFHGQRQLANLKSGDALRTAQIEMRKSELFQHPYYWAPFILVGAGV
jgi:CHAT domain-containing protein